MNSKSYASLYMCKTIQFPNLRFDRYICCYKYVFGASSILYECHTGTLSAGTNILFKLLVLWRDSESCMRLVLYSFAKYTPPLPTTLMCIPGIQNENFNKCCKWHTGQQVTFYCIHIAILSLAMHYYSFIHVNSSWWFSWVKKMTMYKMLSSTKT